MASRASHSCRSPLPATLADLFLRRNAARNVTSPGSERTEASRQVARSLGNDPKTCPAMSRTRWGGSLRGREPESALLDCGAELPRHIHVLRTTVRATVPTIVAVPLLCAVFAVRTPRVVR